MKSEEGEGSPNEDEEDECDEPPKKRHKFDDVKMEKGLIAKIEKACEGLNEKEKSNSVVFQQLKAFTAEQKEEVAKQSKKADKKDKDEEYERV